MIKKQRMISFLVASLFLLSSCNVDGGNNVDLTSVTDNQKNILIKLEAIEKNQLGLKTSIA